MRLSRGKQESNKGQSAKSREEGLLGVGYAYLIGQIVTAILFLWVVWRK